MSSKLRVLAGQGKAYKVTAPYIVSRTYEEGIVLPTVLR